MTRTVPEELAEALPPGAVVTDPDITEAYRHDRAETVDAGSVLAVVRAGSTADVQATIRVAARNRVPVVTRGAGTGLSGGATAVDGCIVVSTERMRSVLVHADSMVVVVQPGALTIEVKEAAREHGLWYPPDPSSFEISSIGGNVATNAGGLCCAKYGVTGDYVLSLEVVLADGTAVRVGAGTLKDAAGYDLKRLFVGSEGTLGVITEATLRLVPAPPPASTIVATFPGTATAGRAVTKILSVVRPSVLELMDRATVRAVEDVARMGLDESCGALLLARTDARHAAESQLLIEACNDAGASYVAATDDESEGDQLMAARRLALPALERLGTVLIEDVGVSVGRIAELVHGIEEVASRRGVMIATFGHAGDGNFHPLLVFDRDDKRDTSKAMAAFADVMQLAVALGGTITGEHGVGTLKRPWLGVQLGTDEYALAKRIKDTLDPLRILNPGKAL